MSFRLSTVPRHVALPVMFAWASTLRVMLAASSAARGSENA